MNQNPPFYSSLKLFWLLLYTDLTIFRRIFLGKLIDNIIYVGATVLVTAYIMPHLGIPTDYSLLIVSGLMATAGEMETFPNAVSLATDIRGNQIISYELTLPLPSWLIPLKIMCYFSFTSATIGIWVLPISKVLMGSQLDLYAIAYGKLTIIFLLANMFCGAFALFLATTIKNMAGLSHIWVRFVFPLWFFGGSQFTWKALYSASPFFAYVNLLNPYMHMTEGTRAAMLGQADFLPFWYSAATLACTTFLMAFWGAKRLRSQLDFVC